jgi:hypothetical protein
MPNRKLSRRAAVPIADTDGDDSTQQLPIETPEVVILDDSANNDDDKDENDYNGEDQYVPETQIPDSQLPASPVSADMGKEDEEIVEEEEEENMPRPPPFSPHSPSVPPPDCSTSGNAKGAQQHDLQEVSANLIVPKAPKKKSSAGKRARVLEQDEASFHALKRRPEDFYSRTVNNFYRPDPEEFILIGQPSVFVTVKLFKRAVYICIRSYHFNQVELKWIPTRTGLNLSNAEWNKLCNPRMRGLVRDAVDQVVNNRGPVPKSSLQREIECPTSFPEEVAPGIHQHRHDLSATKKIVIDKHYSAMKGIQVSLLQFDDATEHQIQDPLRPIKGIHLSLSTWKKLCDEIDTINKKIEDVLDSAEV